MDKYGESQGGSSPRYSTQYAAANAMLPYPPPRGGNVNQEASALVVREPVGQPEIAFCLVRTPDVTAFEAPDHLVMAILATIFCCWPLGIVAIIKANECRTARQRGDRDAALRKGREAKKFSLIAIGLGIASAIIFGIIAGVQIAAALDAIHNAALDNL